MVEYFSSVVTSYWFWSGIGLIAGSSLGLRNTVKNGNSFPLALFYTIAAVYGGLIGARGLYILIYYPQLFRDDIILAFAFWQSTGTWLGGPILGCFSVAVIIRLTGKPVWSNIGSLVPGLVLAHIITRIGCIFHGCCYGAPCDLPWAIFSERLQAYAHPTPVYSMIGELIALFILQFLWQKKENRLYLFPLYGLMLSTHRFISEFFRGDVPMAWIIPGLRSYQTVCIIIFVISTCLLVILRWKKRGAFVAILIITISVIAILSWQSAYESINPVSKTSQGEKYLVITRDLFENKLDKWKKERENSGFEVILKSWRESPSSSEIKSWINSQVEGSGNKIRYVMIVGDCSEDNNSNAKWHVPVMKNSLTFSRQKRVYSTDVTYGDIDDDGCPDISVGRLPVKNVKELKIQIEKIIKRRRIVEKITKPEVIIWAGAGEYTTNLDQSVNSYAKRLSSRIKLQYISDSDKKIKNNSKKNNSKFLKKLNTSVAISLIVSHGSFNSVVVRNKNGFGSNLFAGEIEKSVLKGPSGLNVLLSCSSGTFNTSESKGRSLAEAFLLHPGGPGAVIAATEINSPLTNSFIGESLMNMQWPLPETVGDLLLLIQKELFRTGDKTFLELSTKSDLIASVSAAIPDEEKATLNIPGLLKYEGLMYNILGDPSLRIFRNIIR